MKAWLSTVKLAWVGSVRTVCAMRAVSAVFAVLAVCAAPAAMAAGPSELIRADSDSATLGAGWQLLTLPKQKPPVTVFTADRTLGRPALRMEAAASYGHMAHPLTGAAPATISWSWRVEKSSAAIDLRSKAGDDSPAKVCLSFDLPLSQVPFFERELLRIARRTTTVPLPAATLCWVWGHAEAAGSVVVNPYTQRVRSIVLRGQRDALGQWFDETRDVAADFRAAFGDESQAVPPVSAVLVGADTDNTGAQTLGYVAGLRLLPATAGSANKTPTPAAGN